MNANLLATAGLPSSGVGCRIAVYDEARRGEVRRFDQISNLDEHVRRITGFLADKRLQGFASACEILSVSFYDCIERGYDAVKEELVAQYGLVHIEAHAYSCPASKATECYEQQIARTARHPERNSLILCSPGHDPYRVRFPGTSSAAVTVGLLRADGSLVGAGLGELLKPELLVTDLPFPALGDDGRIVPVTGTSPAVTFVAGLAALLHEQLRSPNSPLQLHAALFLLSTPCRGTYLLDRIDVLRQPVAARTLQSGRGHRRTVKLRICRNADALCRVSIAADACNAASLTPGHRFALTIHSDIDGAVQQVADHRLLLRFDDLAANELREITLQIDGLSDACALAWTGARVDVLVDDVTPVKQTGDTAVVGISASHDASAVLALNGQLIAGIQLERLTRTKHDGQSSLSHDDAIQYCLDVAGLAPDDVDVFAFNVQALTPSYVGLSQPLARKDFTAFDPFGPKAMFVSHHLCHAFAGYSGSGFDTATVVVADGSGGVTVGHDDLVLDGKQLEAYLRRGKGDDPLKLHTFSVYQFSRQGYQLKHREYASSFNVRSGSESLGETYAAVSQFVFSSWQASGKLMGLAPYGTAAYEDSYLKRGTDGNLNFSSDWKLSANLVPAGSDVMRFANLAARIQMDLETAVLDRFKRYVGSGTDLVYSGGIALNSVVNHRIRLEVRPQALYLLPAQHDAGVAIGAAAAAIHRLSGQTPSRLFQHDFLGYRYTERDVALAINEFADRLQVRRVTPSTIATRIADGAVFGFFSLRNGSEFGPRALGARSILADPRKRSVWNFVNKWVKYREEFRPFAPMVTAEALTDYFDAKGRFPYMLEVVKVREAFRTALAGITHVDGSARVQTITADGDPEIHALLLAFQSVGGVPILLNTSFNVRGQPMVEKPKHALEMLLSTQLSGVIFGDLLVERADGSTDVTRDDYVTFSPGTTFELTANEHGLQGVMRVRSQGKTIRLHAAVSQTLQAVAAGCNVGSAILRGGEGHEAMCLEALRRFVRLRMLNRRHPSVEGTLS